MLPVPNATNHSYFDSLFENIHSCLFSGKLKTFCLLPMYCRLEDFFYVKKNPQICNTGSTENWVLHGFGRHVVRLRTVPNLVMADREFELWTGSNMGSSDLEF